MGIRERTVAFAVIFENWKTNQFFLQFFYPGFPTFHITYGLPL
jgi:hypothetical protein